MKLNEIRDNKGATSVAMRVGRGIGTGKGKTGGRGMKGQKSRSGVSIKGFEGGQMPIYQRLPKRGFNMHNPKQWVVVNLGRIQMAANEGRIDLSKPVTRQELQLSGLLSKRPGNVRLLAKGEITAKLDITVTAASKSAIAAVEKAGGTVTLVEKTPPIKLEKDAIAGRKATEKKTAKPAKPATAQTATKTATPDVAKPAAKKAAVKAKPAKAEAKPVAKTATKKPATKKPATKSSKASDSKE